MDGILPLFKPKGMTSHDCVFKLRKMLKIKKIGHTGTLDPDVNGVLPICIGKATKVAEYITEAGKTYEGEVTIGYSTTTEDASGDIVEQMPGIKTFTREEILQVLHSFRGEIVQTPPMYSAVKVNGKRLYEYARLGIEVERPSRKVTIYSIELLDERNIFEGETVTFRFRVSCSKGTYIRTLAVMIGEKLGFPAHMSDLIRIQSAGFTLADSLTFEQIQTMIDNETISEALFPVEAALSHLPKYQLDDKVAEKVKNGAVLSTPKQLEKLDGPVVFETKTGIALAIYKLHPLKKGFMKPEKVLRNE
ncbi:tRNA pseudouridine(55) synthase TruB [Bacillus methanolicus]|uniref:tRNA pseudouridine synthase B n=1 Tax=Bacillus methanolicus (strain MGA3 / ATCC 53907) TaxID=796606 RepID=I3DZF6_BACMM|nr:tRNA pseudouridine(55) synthase TruB [Bacillus methanolicus]AIE59696.1 tRNA pseudouridine synthase B [Bacillus methanolicus MGA3]EIJ79627.1 tRNA pseudouridine synthase B [Bacillus methanolicus MGA3]